MVIALTDVAIQTMRDSIAQAKSFVIESFVDIVAVIVPISASSSAPTWEHWNTRALELCDDR